jgi:hypothetical protein
MSLSADEAQTVVDTYEFVDVKLLSFLDSLHTVLLSQIFYFKNPFFAIVIFCENTNYETTLT